MRKEFEVTDTEYEYYCDICGEQQLGYTAMGSYTYPAELLERCPICGLEICPLCRTSLPEHYIYDCSKRIICKLCATNKADDIITLYKHLQESYDFCTTIHKNLFKQS